MLKEFANIQKSIWWVSWPRPNAASYQPRNLNSSQVLHNFSLHITCERAVGNPSAIAGQTGNILTSRTGLWARCSKSLLEFKKHLMGLLAETKRRVIPGTKFKFFIKHKNRRNCSCAYTHASVVLINYKLTCTSIVNQFTHRVRQLSKTNARNTSKTKFKQYLCFIVVDFIHSCHHRQKMSSFIINLSQSRRDLIWHPDFV